MSRSHRSHFRPTALVLALALVTAGCSGTETDPPAPSPSASPPPSGSTPAPSESPSEMSVPSETTGSPEPPHPVSVPALAAREHRGDRLRLGAVREQTASFTSYDVTYRSRTRTRTGPRNLTISGVLNVPRGEGPFPAVVLAHGYIDPDVYVRGQGMTRERAFLAERGYVALHVDYRNHAESTDDPRGPVAVELGYSADIINAVHALRGTREVPVDRGRIGWFGRSMGGGVVMKALIAEPGLVDAGVAWASVSSREIENYRRFDSDDPGQEGSRRSPRFWRGVSARPYLDEITEPVLLVHGRNDSTCPPAWARATQRAMRRAGVDSTLEWYDDAHAFGPAFVAAMDRTMAFLDARLRG